MTQTNQSPVIKGHALEPMVLDAIGVIQKLNDLTQPVLDAIVDTAIVREFSAGQYPFHKGDDSSEFYIVVKGRIRLFHHEDTTNTEQDISVLEQGSIFGEMAMLDGSRRSLTACADTDAVLLEIDPDNFKQIPNGRELLFELKANLAIELANRVRSTTDNYVATLERELESNRLRQQFGRFFLYTLGLMAVGTVVNDTIARSIVIVDIYTEAFAWQYLLVLLLPSLVTMQLMGIHVRELGLSGKGLWRSILEGLLFSVIISMVIAIIGYSLYKIDMLPGTPLAFDPAGILPYLTHSFLQEMVARGFMQNSFQRFLDDRKGFRSVILTSTLFGLFHLHFGLAAVLLTIVSSVGFGLFYLLNKNLAGVTLVHFTAGISAFAFGLL